MLSVSFRRNTLSITEGGFCCGDCFVALRAPRNDGAIRPTTSLRAKRSNLGHSYRFTFQTAKAPPPLFSQGAGSAGHFHPLAHEGRTLLHKREGSGAPKGAGNIDTPCGARPVRWAFTSRRSTAAFS